MTRLNIKPTSEAIELMSSPSSTDEEALRRPCPASPSPSPGRPAGCNSLGQPAEIAESNPIPEVPGDTGCTCDLDSERKTIPNRFDFKRRRYWCDGLEPGLASYLNRLHAVHPKGHPDIFKFKKEVAECKGGMFEGSWYLRVVKARFSLEQAGIYLSPIELSIKHHGRHKIIGRLKDHSIPYVPRIPPPGHEVKWPDKYEFVTNPELWTSRWRNISIYKSIEGAAD